MSNVGYDLKGAKAWIAVGNFSEAEFCLRSALGEANRTKHPARGRILAALSYTRRAMVKRRQFCIR